MKLSELIHIVFFLDHSLYVRCVETNVWIWATTYHSRSDKKV